MKKFSVKKMLLTIICSVLVTTSLGFTLQIPGMLSQFIMTEEIGVDNNKTREALVGIGKSYEESTQKVEERIEQEKEKYGEDYPAKGIFLYRVQISTYRDILETYLITVMAGVLLGVFIYVIWIQNAKGKQLVIEIIATFFAMIVMAILVKTGYSALISLISKTGKVDTIDLNGIGILALFGILLIAVYITNFIYQKYMSNKLNKKLNNN